MKQAETERKIAQNISPTRSPTTRLHPKRILHPAWSLFQAKTEMDMIPFITEQDESASAMSERMSISQSLPGEERKARTWVLTS